MQSASSATISKALGEDIKATSKTFPPYIYNNPGYESIGKNFMEAMKLESCQMEDFRKAYLYAEKNILSQPLQKWTADDLLHMLDEIYAAMSKSILTYTEGKPGYRTEDSECVTRESPLPDTKFNIMNPGGAVKLLIMTEESTEVATYFLRWHLKYFAQNWQAQGTLAEFGKNMENLMKEYQVDIEQWRKTYFSGKPIAEWHTDFFKESKLPTARSASRHRLEGLFTKEELAAQQKVIHFFVPPEEIKERMEKMARKLIQMIQEKCDPIKIAAYLHLELTGIHPWTNCNGRVARLMVNSILMLSDYPALQLELYPTEKREYCLALEKGDRDPLVFEEYLRLLIQQQKVADLAETLKNTFTKKEPHISTFRLFAQATTKDDNPQPLRDIIAEYATPQLGK